jgi:hypothetical protein
MKIYIAYSLNDGGFLPDSVQGYYLSKKKAEEETEKDTEVDWIDTDNLENSSVHIDQEDDENV